MNVPLDRAKQREGKKSLKNGNISVSVFNEEEMIDLHSGKARFMKLMITVTIFARPIFRQFLPNFLFQWLAPRH
jgi:hypothetical protein